MNNLGQVQRFYFLDILQGFASFAILIWHYQHFFFDGVDRRQDFDRTSQPAYTLLKPFYEYGELAVYLFFILSGFVFFSLYSAGIANRSVTLKTFVWNRFSRLYPLHFATLLLTCGLQLGYYRLFNTFFVYRYNDLMHFLLQLGFMSYWGFQDGHSFNGPIWSVSVEVMLYGIFLAFCRFVPLEPRFLVAMSVLGLAIGGVHAGAGVLCFFVGGILHWFFEKHYGYEKSDLRYRWLPCIIVPPACMAFYLSTFAKSNHFKIHIACVSILPATVYFLAWLQTRFATHGRLWAVFGEMTYASYLLHFPIQIVFHTLFVMYGYFNPAKVETLVAFVTTT